jgi:hypothetical protein
MRSSQHAAAGAPVPRPRSKSEPRQPAPQHHAPADFAFTHDPLSGSVTLHSGPDATQRIVEGTAVEDPAIARRLGAYQGYGEPGQVALAREATASWSDLEPAALRTREGEPAPFVAPVPSPDAVH